MRVPINLASEPFRRDRALLMASAAAGVVLAALLVVMVWLAMAERERTREAREALEKANRQLSALTAERSKLETELRRPENAEVMERVRFANVLLLRKGVSWTRIFSDLEGVLPPNVRLISVRPQISGQNDLLLDMIVAAQTPEPVLQYLMQLEGSTLFGATTIHNWLPPSQTDPQYRYRISVTYGQKL